MSALYKTVKSAELEFYVSELSRSIKGVNLFDISSIQVHDSCNLHILVVGQMFVLLQQFPKLTKDFGNITGFLHQPIANTTTMSGCLVVQ